MIKIKYQKRKPTSNDSIGGGNGRDDVLDDTLGELVGDAVDLVLLGPLLGRLVQPGHVVGVICVDLGADGEGCLQLLVGPGDEGGPLDAVLGQTGCVGDGAEGEGDLGWEGLQRALEARRDAGQDHPRLALEALCSSYTQW